MLRPGMDAILDFFRWLIQIIREPGELITWGGYPGLALIVFLETGALVFFLPGDSLLVMAGLYAAKGDLNLLLLNGIVIPAACLGPLLSYFIGARMGPRLFNKPRSKFFRPEHLRAAHGFYERHGGKAIIIARFMPLVRTFVPVIAGMAKMQYRRYLAFTVIGAVAWVLSMTLLGYLLGVRFPVLGQHIEKVIIAVVVLSLLPAIIGYIKARRSGKKGVAAAVEGAAEAVTAGEHEGDDP
jgi:membrane-associated protein